MSYREDMLKCRAYIDEHPEDITAQELAAKFGYSFWHFCHIFRSVNGISVGTYLRERRLARAAVALLTGASVTEAAGRAGFDTPSGFTRAFTRSFGVGPSVYQKQKGGLVMTENIKAKIEVTMAEIPAFSAAGYKVYPETALDSVDELRNSGAYWLGKDFSAVSAEDYASLTYPGYAEIGMWLAGGATMESLYYFLGPTVKEGSKIPDGMEQYDFEAAECAVFKLPQAADMPALQQTVRSGWQYIFTEWFEENPYQLDESKPYFECYRGDDAYICVPILKK